MSNSEDTSNYCPRALLTEDDRVGPVTIEVATDPALQEVARIVVAGVDRRFELDPMFEEMSRFHGRQAAEASTLDRVRIPGCDVIQTEMGLGGLGLFGSVLPNNGKKFKFYEWTSSDEGQLFVRLSAAQAREIVSGGMTEIVFEPVVHRSLAALVDLYVMHCLFETHENSRHGITEWVHAREADGRGCGSGFSPADYEVSLKRLLRAYSIEKIREEESDQGRSRSIYSINSVPWEHARVRDFMHRFKGSIASVFGLEKLKDKWDLLFEESGRDLHAAPDEPEN